jgi:mannose-1-phosphate guanylyltransferase
VPELGAAPRRVFAPSLSDAVLIMAAGTGTRLWPLSRETRPKQFAHLLAEDETPLQATVRRALRIADARDVFVSVGARHAHWVREQCPELPPDNSLVLPAARETLPGVAYATAAIAQRRGAPLLVLASDNVVGDAEAFAASCREMLRAATESASLVSLGIRPTHASTAYGYMLRGAPAPFGPRSAWGVGYVEKPPRELAEAFLAGGRHDWNSGMFAWRPETFFAAWALVSPEAAQDAQTLRDALATGRADAARDAYLRLPDRSLDHGLMELLRPDHAVRHVFVTGDFAWDDVGSFAALARHLYPDGQGNRLRGSVLLSAVHESVLIAEPGWQLDVRGVSELLVVVGEAGELLIRPVGATGSEPARDCHVAGAPAEVVLAGVHGLDVRVSGRSVTVRRRA